MNGNAALEARIGRLLDAYADQAAIDVDPMATARLAAAGLRGPAQPAIRPGRLGLRFALVVVAALALVGGALLAGAPWPEPEPVIPGDPVEPFLGLPPPGAAVSHPERGHLELSFGGRIRGRGYDRMWAYADGRLITLWEEDYPGAVQERRLSPEGVELLRSELLRTAEPAPDLTDPGLTVQGRAGVIWGGASVRIGDVVVPVTWSDGGLPRRLVDPASWLPAWAWQESEAIGYVAARYAVCLWPDASPRTLAQLPRAATDLLLAHGTPHLGPGLGTPVPECFEVSTDRAREVEAALLAGGLHRTLSHAAYFWLDDARVNDILRILPITPDGEVICSCG